MKIACPKKIVSNIPVLASVCFMMSVYLTQYSASQALFIKFMARWCRKCYNIGSFPKILLQLDVNECFLFLKWYSGYTNFFCRIRDKKYKRRLYGHKNNGRIESLSTN